MSKFFQICRISPKMLNMPKIPRFCPYLSLIDQVFPNLSKNWSTLNSNQNCPKLVEIVQNWSNLSKIGQICPKLVKFVQKWPNMSKIDKCVQINNICREIAKFPKFKTCRLITKKVIFPFQATCSSPHRPCEGSPRPPQTPTSGT